MRSRFLASLFVAAVAAAYAAPAGAEPGQWVEPPKKLPHVQHGNPTHNLDFLFGALKVAPDDITAKAVEERIWALWTASRSDTITLLMSRVQAATEAKDIDLAITLLDAVIKIKPKYVEAWNRRATIYYMKKDYGHALATVGERMAVVFFHVVDGGAPVPGFHVFRLDLDDGVKQRDREIDILCLGRGLHARHQQRDGVAARGGPQRPDAFLDRLGGYVVGRDLERPEKEIEIVRGVAVLDMRQLFRRLDPLPRLGTDGRGIDRRDGCDK